MLVLTRKADEKICLHIGDDVEIEITVVSVGARQVKLGVEAPKQVIVLRGELGCPTNNP